METTDLELGKKLLSTPGALMQWRQSVGLTRNAAADLFGVTIITYRKWERRPVGSPWRKTAESVGRFYRLSNEVVQELSDRGVSMSELMPLREVAARRGLTAEGAFMQYRKGNLPDVLDLGVLGLWLPRTKV